MFRKLVLSLVLAQALAAVAVAQVDDEDQPRGQAGTPTFHFIGDRYRIGVGLDSEYDVIGEFQAALHESQRSSFIGEGWLGGKGAAGVKLNYHWLIRASAEEGPDGPVYTDGSVAKLFVAADQNEFDDRKLTAGAGWEGQRWAFAGYGMTALTSERLVDRRITIDERLMTGRIDGHDFSRIDTIETITEWFEEPYDWGLGARAERFFENQLIRLRGGLDYEDGDYGSSQLTASLSLDKHFHNSPHSLSFRTSYAHKDGDYVLDSSDWRGSVVYSYSIGGGRSSFRPARQYRDMEFEVPGAPRVEERVVVNEVTMTDQATFDFDRSELKPAARNTLDEVLAVIEDGGLVGKIQIVGHTCDIGTEAYNQGLSERRARSVVDYLTAHGVAPGQIEWEGRGELEPRFPNDSPENRAKNRRVEISFVTERRSTERITVGPDEPATEVRQVEVPVEAPWIRRALRNPVRHKRIVDYYRYQESTTSVTEGQIQIANEAPVAVDDQFSVDADSVDNPLDVLANDSDPDGDVLTIVSVTTPANGQATISGEQVLYTPNAGFTGTDRFSYTIEDGFGGQASATVTVMVQSLNQPPVAGDVTATTQRNQPVDIDVLASASDPDGDELSIAAFTQPDNGTVSQVGDILRYQPDRDFVGSDGFEFTVSDGRGGEATARVTITVQSPPNQPPVADDVTATTQRNQPVDIDVLASASDPDGDELSIAAFTQPDNGTVSQVGDILRYQPDRDFVGSDGFEFTVSDGRGGEASATVNITVSAAPSGGLKAVPDSYMTEPGQTTITVHPMENDSGESIRIVDMYQWYGPAADFTINADGSVTLDLTLDCDGRHYFKYTIEDIYGDQDSANITLIRVDDASTQAALASSGIECPFGR